MEFTLENKKTFHSQKQKTAECGSENDHIQSGNNQESFSQRWELLKAKEIQDTSLLASAQDRNIDTYQKNIENFIGTVKLPVGLAGPLRVQGYFAHKDYHIPLATTEAALVASYHRGCKAITVSGGCKSFVIENAISRSPGFEFKSVTDSLIFLSWIQENLRTIQTVAENTTRHGKLQEIRPILEANRVLLDFAYTTGSAAGQNMVTIATQAAFDFILKNSPVLITAAFVEANFSSDKKSAFASFLNTRGRKVIAEVIIPVEVVRQVLKTDVASLVKYSSMKDTGSRWAGAMGSQGHYANAITAFAIACGQDPACAAESAIGVTVFGETPEGDFYASVTMPNIIVGTVGGGTSLPSQKECLKMLNLNAEDSAHELAEVLAGLCLAGEISIAAAMATNTFSKAHQQYARTDCQR